MRRSVRSEDAAREPYGAADGLVRVYPAGRVADAPSGELCAALVWAHGGGFAGGELDMPEADWVASSLAARGITVVSVDYRLVGDGCRYPAPSDDVLTAWRWTVAHAAELGVDSARLAIGGASAGANLAAGAALRLLTEPGQSATPMPSGVFLAYPTLLAEQPAPDASLRALLDTNPAADRFRPADVRAMYEDFLGGPVDDAPLPAVPGRAAGSDVAGLPPVLMINSEADELRVSGEVFAATLAGAGVPIEVVVEPGTEHGHLNRPGEPAASASIERVVRWVGGLAASDHLTTLRSTEGTSS